MCGSSDLEALSGLRKTLITLREPQIVFTAPMSQKGVLSERMMSCRCFVKCVGEGVEQCHNWKCWGQRAEPLPDVPGKELGWLCRVSVEHTTSHMHVLGHWGHTASPLKIVFPKDRRKFFLTVVNLLASLVSRILYIA